MPYNVSTNTSPNGSLESCSQRPPGIAFVYGASLRRFAVASGAQALLTTVFHISNLRTARSDDFEDSAEESLRTRVQRESCGTALLFLNYVS